MPYKIKPKGNQHCVVVSAGPKKGKEVACHATKADATKQIKALYANDAAFLNDQAERGYQVPCIEGDCAREFIVPSLMFTHHDRVHVNEKTIERAEALLTFDDTRKIVHEFIREKFGRQGDYKATPIIPSIWTWIEDMAVDWVVYTVENGNDTTLFKASFSITDGVVTLGEPVEVRRRTVYEPVKKKDED